MAFPSTYESIIKEENISNGGYVQMEWNDTDSVPIATGTTCPVDGDYMMFSTYYPSQSAVKSYRYSPKFLHRLAQLDYLPFYFKTKAVIGTDSGGRVTYEDVILSTYPYTGNISTIANALAACLSDHGDLGAWTADTSGLSDNIIHSVSFDGATIKSAAQAIAEAFGVDYYFIWNSRAIKFGAYTAGSGGPGYGKPQMPDDGITEKTDSLVSATDGGVQYNTFRILGGTRNMSKKTIKGQNVQVTQRLMLDENNSIMGGGTPKIMKDLVFDDIYPKMELWMYDVHERRCWLTDENGKKIVDSQYTDKETGGTVTVYKQYSKWYFKLSYWNGEMLVPYMYDPSLQIKGMPLSLVFQPNYADGALAQPLVGREYELTYFDAANPPREKEDDDVDANGYQPSHGEYRIIFKVDGNMILPSTSEEGIRPYGDDMSLVNNKVTLVNVAMDDVYKKAAQAELRKAGQDAVAAYMRDKSSFTYLTYGTAPSIGGIARSGGMVTSVRTDLITGEVQYTVGDYQSSRGLIGRLSDKIDTAGTSGGSGTTREDGNVSIRGGGVSESSIPLLSRLMGSGNVVKDSLTILKELILGTNGHGVFIDGNGDANMTIGSLTVLGTTHLNEIDVNHVRHTGGLMLVTKANIIVDHTEHLDGGLDKLYFRRRDANGQTIYNQFIVGDLALMMTFNEAMDGSINRYFWREVTAIDDGTEEFGYITLLPSSATHSDPREGDVVVQLGNTTVPERQGCTVLGGSGKNGGFIAVYDGFKTWRNSAPSLDDYDSALTYISPRRNKMHGQFVNVAGDDLQSQLDALRASLLSVSQQSDKQLVIWYGDDDTPCPAPGNLGEYNEPAKDWHNADAAAGNTEQQQLHLEDVYYLRRNGTTRKGGRAWQWIYDADLGQFLWIEITDADTIAALEAADNAQAVADDARQKVEALADDGVISAGTEKSELLTRWQDTVAEYIDLMGRAKDYDLDKVPDGGSGINIIYSPYNDYVRKYRVLAVMLNDGSTDNINSILTGNAVPAWLVSLNVDTELKPEDSTEMSDLRPKPSEYREVWKNYYDARSVLENTISGDAKNRTDEAQDTANQKKRIFQTSGNELPPAPYDVGDLWLNVVWYTEKTEGGQTIRYYRWRGDQLVCTKGRTTDATRSIYDWTDAASGTTARLANLGDRIEAEVTDRKNMTQGSLCISPTSGSLCVRAMNENGNITTSAVIEAFVYKDPETGEYTSKMNLTADNVEINAALMTLISESVKVKANQVDFTVGVFTIGADHIDFKSKEVDLSAANVTLNAGQLTFAGEVIDLSAASVTLGADQVTFAGKTATLGTEGSKFTINGGDITVEAGKTLAFSSGKIDFTGAEIKLNADQLTFAGRTIDLSAASVTLGADQVTFAGKTATLGTEGSKFTINGGDITVEAGKTLAFSSGKIDFTGAEIKLNADQLTFAGRTIDLSAASVTLGADQVTFAGKTATLGTEGSKFTINGGDITVEAGKTLAFSSGKIDFTGAEIKLGADQITFTGKTIINDKFVVHDDGHLQLDYMVAANATITGKVNATSGVFRNMTTPNGNFSIDDDGNVKANNLDVTNGKFSGLIDAECINLSTCDENLNGSIIVDAMQEFTLPSLPAGKSRLVYLSVPLVTRTYIETYFRCSGGVKILPNGIFSDMCDEYSANGRLYILIGAHKELAGVEATFWEIYKLGIDN